MANQYGDILPPLSTEDKMLAGLCYPFWAIIPFFVLASSKRKDPFLLFHSVQGLAIGLLTTGLSVAGLFFLWISFSSLPTSYIMTSGLIGVFLVLAALGFGGFCFAVSIFLGWQASSGRFIRVPVLGDMCEARMAHMLELSPVQLRQLAVDRELVPEEKVTVLQAVSTPEQLQAEMDRWAQPAATAESWWGAKAAAEARPPAESPAARPTPPRPASDPPARSVAEPKGSEVRPWKPAVVQQPVEARPEVKPWRPASAASSAPAPAPAQPAPRAKPVSFPSVSRSEPEEPKKKWWVPKEG